jgi:hypothetical protein
MERRCGSAQPVPRSLLWLDVSFRLFAREGVASTWSWLSLLACVCAGLLRLLRCCLDRSGEDGSTAGFPVRLGWGGVFFSANKVLIYGGLLAGLTHAFCDTNLVVWTATQFPYFAYTFYLSKASLSHRRSSLSTSELTNSSDTNSSTRLSTRRSSWRRAKRSACSRASESPLNVVASPRRPLTYASVFPPL